ncbi:MAG TPA: FecR domain-containing protein [Chitinophaga sp.]|uniref:FecR domain-containing protein n=1 Tax=Chitinophaga sp. TaxID=1869181 RepID=UPI002CC20CD6|nr:FecR domain-containing protein [Chitinophaga sp.]HVI43679.1 FecR domain-containing protein [Chitinophaga sp.]
MWPNYSNEQIDNLITQFLSGNATPEEQKQLEHWVSADSGNRQYFLRLRDAWLATAKSGVYDDTAAWEKLVQQLPGASVAKTGRWRNYLRAAASFLLPFALGGALVYGWKMQGEKGSQGLVTVTSPKGATTKIELPDGTEVWLNADSKLQYAQSYNEQRREVKLEGEAFFRVQTNPRKPFTVNASDLNILALGTSFNVKAYPEDKTVVTTLVDGEVKIDGSQTASPFNLMLKPHQHVIYKKQPAGEGEHAGIAAVKKTDDSSATVPIESREVNNTEIYTAWKDGNWIVSAQTLDELAVTMERRFNVKVVFKDTELRTYRFSGTFRQETLEQILNILKLTAPLSYTIDKGEVMLSVDKELKEKYANALHARK